jgi:hypothetical protein
MTPARAKLVLQLRVAGFLLIGLGIPWALQTPLQFVAIPLGSGASPTAMLETYFQQFSWWASVFSLARWIAGMCALVGGAYLIYRDARRLVRVTVESSA